jgi:acetyl-CoA acetyltransferase
MARDCNWNLFYCHAVTDRTPVIAGIGLSDYPKAPDLDIVGHHSLAMQRALGDCGMEKRELDGYVSAGQVMTDDAVTMAEYLGVDHRFIDGTMTGGTSFEFHVQHAAAAIRDGVCDSVLITYGSNQLTRMGRKLGTGGFLRPAAHVSGPLQYEAPYGLSLVGAYAMAARRHMHEYGTTPAQLASIAVGVREFASLNPNAMYRSPLTVDDVLDSRLVADPLHKLDCCVISDGGGAVIMTTAERARDLRQPAVYVLGAAGAQTHWNISQMPDFTTTAAAISGPIAFERAGLTPDDVDTIQFYDSFTITVLLLLEGTGFCKRGEGGPFVETGALRRGGSLPLNTDGGGLSSNHPGMRGIFLLIEATRQLRHQAGEAQVPECNVALACGSGGWLSCMGTVILGREHP